MKDIFFNSVIMQYKTQSGLTNLELVECLWQGILIGKTSKLALFPCFVSVCN